ncbi:ABC transporter substrate-binding protein [Caballeronia sp. DA-9]|uniref:ABC transporter substrate-binding protein n=1 Tax=Caballeronia sp. DA-9 TaxID=3436237 RepID=UPI003F67F850
MDIAMRRSTSSSLRHVFNVLTALLSTLLVAFSPALFAQTIKVPADIQATHILRFCSDLSNPPADGIADDGFTPSGAEVDVMNGIGRELGVKTEISNFQFSGIFGALDTGKCDMVMASLGKTADRAKRYELIDYWSVASGLLVPKGNPKHLTRYEDLTGQRVAVLLGSRNSKVLHAMNEKLIGAGKPPMEIVELGTNVDAFQDLTLGRVDAFSSDTLNINFYKSRGRGKFEIGGVPVPPVTWAIALQKGNEELRQAVQAAIDRMNANGQMLKIAKTWGIADGVGLCSTAHPCE